MTSLLHKKILITSIYYAPEAFANAPYVTAVAEHYAAQGATVTVVTGQPHYPERRIIERRPARETLNGVLLRRRWHVVNAGSSALGRLIYDASFLVSGTLGLPRTRPDAIVGVSPTLSGAALAWLFGRIYRRPYGVVFQDMMGRAAAQSELRGGRLVASAVARAEGALARAAEAVGIVSPGFSVSLRESGVEPSRIHHLPNWTHIHGSVTESREATRKRVGWSEADFICLHSGNMGQKQGLDNVVRAATLLRDENVRIVLAGDGNDRVRLQILARELRLENVDFLPIQPSGRYEALLQAADLLLVNQRPTVLDMSLPSRLTSYFAAERPVLAAVAPGSETEREVTRSGAGIAVGAGDPVALANAIRALKNDRTRSAALGVAGGRYAEELRPARALARYERFAAAVLSRSSA